MYRSPGLRGCRRCGSSTPIAEQWWGATAQQDKDKLRFVEVELKHRIKLAKDTDESIQFEVQRPRC